MDTNAARARLEQMLAELEASARALQAEGAGENSELSHYDQHQADTATLLADADREEAAIEVVLAQRDGVRAALSRLDEGTYGRCVSCGATIPAERLEARPEAERCVRCQAAAEAQR